MAVDSVRESLHAHGDRYLERVYTPRELEDCTATAGPDPERLAGRFAAKEAAVKVIRPGETGMSLREIEVTRQSDGSVGLSLSGTAERIAGAAGLGELSLSISHEGGFATAVVAGFLGLRNPADDPMMKR